VQGRLPAAKGMNAPTAQQRHQARALYDISVKASTRPAPTKHQKNQTAEQANTLDQTS
jgi:hypothetical protein